MYFQSPYPYIFKYLFYHELSNFEDEILKGGKKCNTRLFQTLSEELRTITLLITELHCIEFIDLILKISCLCYRIS